MNIETHIAIIVVATIVVIVIVYLLKRAQNALTT
jgi:hypothetical protein